MLIKKMLPMDIGRRYKGVLRQYLHQWMQEIFQAKGELGNGLQGYFGKTSFFPFRRRERRSAIISPSNLNMKFSMADVKQVIDQASGVKSIEEPKTPHHRLSRTSNPLCGRLRGHLFGQGYSRTTN